MFVSDKQEGSVPILPRGIHQFPFRFQLPESALPCSFESKPGYIRYYIKVRLLLDNFESRNQLCTMTYKLNYNFNYISVVELDFQVKDGIFWRKLQTTVNLNFSLNSQLVTVTLTDLQVKFDSYYPHWFTSQIW